jgi:hypothetical protein
MFVADGIDEPRPIASMPGVVQHTRDSLRRAAADAVAAGVGGLMLFGVPREEDKDGTGSVGVAEDGILTVILAIDKHSHRIIAGPDIVSRGFVAHDDNVELFEACRRRVIQAFEDCDKESQEEWDVVKTAVRKALRKFLRDELDRYPMIVPVVVEI